jgi:hypothetical protein
MAAQPSDGKLLEGARGDSTQESFRSREGATSPNDREVDHA